MRTSKFFFKWIVASGKSPVFWHPNQILRQLYFDVCQTILVLSYALYLQYTVYNLSFFLPVSKKVCHWRLTAKVEGSKTTGVHTTLAFIIPFVGAQESLGEPLHIHYRWPYLPSPIFYPVLLEHLRPRLRNTLSKVVRWSTWSKKRPSANLSSNKGLGLKNNSVELTTLNLGIKNRNGHPNMTELTRQIWDQTLTCTFSSSRNYSQDGTLNLVNWNISGHSE